MRYKRLTGRILTLTVISSLLFNIQVYAAVSVSPATGQITNGQTAGGQTTGEKTTGGQTTSEKTTGGQTTAGQTSDTASSAKKPEVAAQGAVLMNADTGEVIFSKGADTKLYPASITKLMTALLVLENCNLDDTVTFSDTATKNLESGAVSLNMTTGDTLSVRDCMYALLLKSANEVANALAEKVAGSNSAFADMMNARAALLGCKNTHFTNPHGLNDSNHYTTAYDMALIAREAFKNTSLLAINGTTSYKLPATKLEQERTITLGHKMFYKTDARYYEGIIGGKTGYTSKAGNTLVTCVEKNGVRLIAVVMKCSGTHYTDTTAMLNYGFAVVKNTKTDEKTETQTDAAGPGTTSQTEAAPETQLITQTGPGISTSEPEWVQDSRGWYYKMSDGSSARDTWLKIGDYNYRFDSDGYMATGWRLLSDKWYYLKPSGAMARNYWLLYKDAWYYLGDDGVMLTDTVTPDGYTVNSDGIWYE